mgnify:CR=1 FL=1
MPPRAQWEAAARAPASAKKRYKSYLAPLGWASPYLACIALALTLTLPLPLTRLGLTLPGVLLVHAALPFWATLLGSARAQAVLHTCTPAQEQEQEQEHLPAQAPVAACGAAVRLRLASLSSRAVAAPYTGLSHAYHGSSRAAPRHAGAAHGLRQIPDAVQGEPPPLGPSRTIPPRPATRLAQPHALPLLPTYCLPLTTDCFLTGLRGQVAIRVGGHGRRHE